MGLEQNVWMSKFERGVDGHIDMMNKWYEIFSDKTNGRSWCGWRSARDG